MTAHQPPTQQTVLVQKQLSHSKLTSITGKCFSTTLNCIWTHRAVADYLLTCVKERGTVGTGTAGHFGCLCITRHRSDIKWIRHSVAAPRTGLTARLHHAAGDRATDTRQPEKNHLHRTRSKMRGRALQLRLFHWWKPPRGFWEAWNHSTSPNTVILIWLMK